MKELYPKKHIAQRHDATGRSTGEPTRKGGLKNSPPNGEAWAWRTFALMESPAMRSLGINARKVLDRIEIEHLAHGRVENGNLIVTHQQFVEWGANHNAVGDAIDELRYKGLIDVLKGRAGLGSSHASRYRLTWIGACDGSPATNEWKGKSQEDVDGWKAKGKEKAKQRRKRAQKKNPHSTFRECATPSLGSARDVA